MPAGTALGQRQGRYLVQLTGAKTLRIARAGRIAAIPLRQCYPAAGRAKPRRGISIAGQRFITTLIPLASARDAAAGSTTLSCIHIALTPDATPSAMASS